MVIFIIYILRLLFTDILKKEFKIENLYALLLFIFGKKDINNGNIVNDDMNIIINPNIIILPKSITGLISENNNDPKATIVVNAVYKQGQNIIFNVCVNEVK